MSNSPGTHWSFVFRDVNLLQADRRQTHEQLEPLWTRCADQTETLEPPVEQWLLPDRQAGMAGSPTLGCALVSEATHHVAQ